MLFRPWILALSFCAFTPLIPGTPAFASLVESVTQAEKDGLSAVIVSSIPAGQWKPADRFRPSEETYRVEEFEPATFVKELQLPNPDTLENSYFKIVENRSEDALPRSDFDGANVLFHLMRARAYFSKLSENAPLPSPALERKIVVRVRVKRGYNLVTHFADYREYNNARYIPAHFGEQWGRELWFHGRKARLQKMDWYGMTQIAGQSIMTQNWATLAVLAPIQLLERFNQGMDSAKMPDVIYHEGFHWATDAEGHFPMAAEGNAVAEDYANYFGSSLNDRPVLADMDEFTSRFYKRNFLKVRKVKDSSPSNYNSMAFGPSLFWQIRKILGQSRADQLIWNSMSWLRGSAHHADVPEAVFSAALVDSSLTDAELDEIRELFEKYRDSYEKLEKKFNLQPKPFSPLPAADPADNDPKDDPERGAVSESSSPAPKHSAFVRKIQAGLRAIARLSAEAARGVGYLGTVLVALINAPGAFASDLVTGGLFGSALISDRETGAWTQITGGIGNLAFSAVIASQWSAAALATISPMNYVGLGLTMTTGLVCKNSDPRGTAPRDTYCATTNQITQRITGTAASWGAEIGIGVRQAVTRFFNWLF